MSSDSDPLLRRVGQRFCSLQKSALFRSLALGQIISLLIAGTGISSSYLVEWGADIPTSQSALNYLLLFIVYTTASFWWRNRALCKLRLAWWKYALLALVDVEANFLIVKAYQYTTITSVMLIDCWTIPCVMLLSWWLLGARFRWQHVLGVFLCLCGLAILVVSDFLSEANSDDAKQRLLTGDGEFVGGIPRAVLGDLLCFLGATLYACSNIAQEVAVKRLDRIEYLGQIGLWGCLISGVQVVVLERSALAAVTWSEPRMAGAFVAFALCLFSMYSATSIFLQMSDATLFNLSLLTSDVWAVVAGAVLFGQRLHGLYFLAAAVIVGGLFLYNLAPSVPSAALAAAAAAATAASAAAAQDENVVGRLDDTTPLASGVDKGAGADAFTETLVGASSLRV